MVVDGIKQRAPQQELGAEDILLGASTVFALADKTDVQQLARVVPFVGGVGQVDTLVALQPDESSA